MNIFVLDNNPRYAAEALCDQDIGKMLVYAAQLLSNAFPEDVAPYDHVNVDHRCSRWVRASKWNAVWLLNHAHSLALEYEVRFHKPHKCEMVIRWVQQNFQMITSPDTNQMTPFEVASPDIFKAAKDPIECYRAYYLFKIRDRSRAGAPCKWSADLPLWVYQEPGLDCEQDTNQDWIIRRDSDVE